MSRKIFGILIAMFLFLSPICVKAKTIYATSEDGSKSYDSISSAWNAAQNGVSIVMQCDWNITSRLVLDKDKKATIEMNGHKISRNLTKAETNGEVIILKEKSTLTLNGYKEDYTKFYFDGFDAKSSREKLYVISGGLITGGSSTNGGGGIHMKEGSTLNLNSVAIAGNYAEQSLGSDGQGGGVCMDGDGDTLNLVEAVIDYNYASEEGGGVYIADEQSTITMKNSSIFSNYAEYGGGIYSGDRYTKITLDNSYIKSNVAKNSGGGIYLENTDFEITSDKANGSISFNGIESGTAGAAIFISQSAFNTNSGLIKGIYFSDNKASDGSIVTTQQENTTISNCTFTTNTSNDGVIYVRNDGFTLEDTSVYENTITDDGYGAVYVDSEYDITLKGKVIIKDNYNTDVKDNTDLYLQTGILTNAYILSVPDSSSSIGLVKTDERVIAKNQTEDATKIYTINGSFLKYCLFYNESDKTISLKENLNPLIFSEANDATDESNVTSETKSYIVTLNKVNESGTWSESETLTVNDGETLELVAPNVEGRTFVEWRDVPENITVDGETIKANSLTGDIILTVVYTDSEGDKPVEELHTVTLNIASSDGTIVSTDQMTFSSLDAFELVAPISEGKTFVEWRDIPEDITVEGETLKADALTSDIEVTAVYSEAQEESSETGSIFGKGSTTVALTVVIVLLAIAGYTYNKNKNKNK